MQSTKELIRVPNRGNFRGRKRKRLHYEKKSVCTEISSLLHVQSDYLFRINFNKTLKNKVNDLIVVHKLKLYILVGPNKAQIRYSIINERSRRRSPGFTTGWIMRILHFGHIQHKIYSGVIAKESFKWRI